MDTRKNTRQRLVDLMVLRIGRSRLAARLGIPLVLLDDWIVGETPVPDAKLVALIDLIDETGAPTRSGTHGQIH